MHTKETLDYVLMCKKIEITGKETQKKNIYTSAERDLLISYRKEIKKTLMKRDGLIAKNA